MSYHELLILSSLHLKRDFVFNPIELDNKRELIKRIEIFLANELETENESDVLLYIERKIQECLNLFSQENNKVRYKNTEFILDWIKEQLDETSTGSSKIQVSQPRVWAYVYY